VITTTLGELLEAHDALTRVMSHAGYNARTRYHLAKLSRLVEAEVKLFHGQREALIETYGTERPTRPEDRQATDTVREVMPDKRAEFVKRLGEVCAVQITIPWGPIRSSDIPESVTPGDVIALGPLCELVEPDA
jgi:hypothetical protein